mmetsp:Transcript_16032/g.30221  ORF Transcript_16032/g.30221 Transcript_16032/m.30221 type:complete len:279 (-) Transcript_16032:59-895(-)
MWCFGGVLLFGLVGASAEPLANTSHSNQTDPSVSGSLLERSRKNEEANAPAKNSSKEVLEAHNGQDVGILSSSTIRVINGCSEPIWMAHCCNYNYAQNVKIDGGASRDFPAYAGLRGFRLWPKMRCNADGNGCRIGQSGGRGQPCGTDGNWRCQAHIDTKFEATFGYRADYYDMSMVDGYTLPFQLRLKGCSIPGLGSFLDCSGLSLDACPRANKEYYNGKLLGCHARGRPGHGTGEYINLVHRLCPKTYAFDLDDANGNHNCPHGTTYEITFLCPAA